MGEETLNDVESFMTACFCASPFPGAALRLDRSTPSTAPGSVSVGVTHRLATLNISGASFQNATFPPLGKCYLRCIVKVQSLQKKKKK